MANAESPFGALPDGRQCPACGAPLQRVHRHALDRWVSLFRSVHRYQCTSVACGWEGVLGRDTAVGPAPTPRWRAALLWFTVGAACALAAVQAARMLRASRSPPPPAPAAAAPQQGAAAMARVAEPGTDFPGARLPPSDERVRQNPSPLQLRHSCAWGVPGANPYRGTVAQALGAAGLPADVVTEIAERAERGWTHGQVEISRAGIRTVDGRRNFPPEVRAMAFGDTLCFNTRVNFPPGHAEYGALYQADGRDGRTYTVIVPYVCQNVSVLGERAEIVEDTGDMPEPSTALLALAGLAAAAAVAASRRRAADAPRS